jgi:hypothetical protein
MRDSACTRCGAIRCNFAAIGPDDLRGHDKRTGVSACPCGAWVNTSLKKLNPARESGIVIPLGSIAP